MTSSSVYKDLLEVAESISKTARDSRLAALAPGTEVIVTPNRTSGSTFPGVVEDADSSGVIVTNSRTGKTWPHLLDPSQVVPIEDVEAREQERNIRDASERGERIRAEQEREEKESAARPGESPESWLDKRLIRSGSIPQEFLARLFDYMDADRANVRVHYAPFMEAHAAALFKKAGRPELADQVRPYNVGQDAKTVTWGVSGRVIFPVPSDDPDLDMLQPWPEDVHKAILSPNGKSYVITDLALTFDLIRAGIRSSIITG